MWRPNLNTSRPVVKGIRGAGTISDIAKDINDAPVITAYDVEKAWRASEHSNQWSIVDVQVLRSAAGEGVHALIEKAGAYYAVPVSVNADHSTLSFDIDAMERVYGPCEPGADPASGEPVPQRTTPRGEDMVPGLAF